MAKGLDKRATVWYQHALKNTMLPVITVGGVQIGTMVAYTILTETVFQWPGTGFLFLEAINRVDTHRRPAGGRLRADGLCLAALLLQQSIRVFTGRLASPWWRWTGVGLSGLWLMTWLSHPAAK